MNARTGAAEEEAEKMDAKETHQLPLPITVTRCFRDAMILVSWPSRCLATEDEDIELNSFAR